MTKVNKEEVYNRLYIAQSKIRDYLEDLKEGKYDLDTQEGKDRFEDRMSTILFNLEEAENTIYYADNGVEEVEEEEPKETYEEFLERVMDVYDYEGKLREVLTVSLDQAIKKVQSNNGYAEFNGIIDGQIVNGRINANLYNVTINIDGIEDAFYYSFMEEVEEDEEESCDCPMCHGKWDEEDEESYQHEEPCTCYACQYEDMNDQETVYEVVSGLSDSITEDAEYIIEAIEEHFGEGTLGMSSGLIEDDYSLLRLYLKLKLNADPTEVESLSNRALMGAWNRHLMLKK